MYVWREKQHPPLSLRYAIKHAGINVGVIQNITSQWLKWQKILVAPKEVLLRIIWYSV